MKPDIHPEYRPVVFQDQSSGDNIIVGSTMQTTETITVDGVEYPLAKVELSSRSHPFFTGQMKIVDTAGRVERFERRYGARKKKPAAAAEEAAAEAPTEEAPAQEPANSEKADDRAKMKEAPATPTEAPVEAEAAAPVEEEAAAPAEEAAAEAPAQAEASADDAAPETEDS